MISLILGVVMSSRAQKFPNMVGELPKLHKELPNAVQCPRLPNCFRDYYPIDRVFNNAGEFLEWLQQHSYCCAVMITYQVAQMEAAAAFRVHVKAQSLREAVCQVVWAYKLTWHTWPISNGYAIVVTRYWPDHICKH